jgi:ubiquinone biosynthesis UbiH/UbiF/VisC/COQ6 family hydroxylase
MPETGSPTASADVAIVGAGVVGSTLALALHRHLIEPGARILLVDPRRAPAWQPINDTAAGLRTVAITPASQRFLASLGVWERLPQGAITAFPTLFAYGRSAQEKITFDAADCVGRLSTEPPALGYIVEETALLETLHRCLERVAGEKEPTGNASGRDGTSSVSGSICWSRACFDTLTWPASHPWAQLHLSEAEHPPSAVAASLVIAADGARSKVRHQTELTWIGRSYHQRAVVAIVENREPNLVAIQRFLPRGPLAILPMGQHGMYSNIVWSTNESEADWLETGASASQFLDATHAALHRVNVDGGQHAPYRRFLSQNSYPIDRRSFPVVPSFQRLIPSRTDGRDRWSFPLHFGSATGYDANRVVLVGDAAHVVHPLAGQGVNLGLADAQTLARVLKQAWQTGRDIGDPSVLAVYTRERLPLNTAMLVTLSALRRVFAFPTRTRGLGSTLASSFRGLGMQFIERVAPLRSSVVRIATGEPWL